MSKNTTSTLIEAEIVSPKSGSKLAATGLHNHYHHCAQASAAQATGYAILCGLELQRVRAEVAQKGGRLKKLQTPVSGVSGGWEKWVEENCDFSTKTALRYISVADGVKGRLKQVGMAKSLAGLIDFAPSDLTDTNREKLLKSVSKVTEGQTLQQLYMDFGITKKDPRENLKKGGATHTKGRGPSKNIDAQLAHDEAADILKRLAEFVQSGQHQLLDRADLQHLDDQLLAAREAFKSYLKK